MAMHDRRRHGRGESRQPFDFTGGDIIVGFARSVAYCDGWTHSGPPGLRGDLVAVRDEKANAMTASARAKCCTDFKLGAMIDYAGIEHLRYPFDGFVEVPH